MRIIISISTIQALTDKNQETANLILNTMGEKTKKSQKIDNMNVTNFKNFKLTTSNGNVELDINDEIMIKYMDMFQKFVISLLPVFLLVKNFFNSSKGLMGSFMEDAMQPSDEEVERLAAEREANIKDLTEVITAEYDAEQQALSRIGQNQDETLEERIQRRLRQAGLID